MIRPSSGGDHEAVYHGFAIDEGSACRLHIRLQGRISGSSSAFEHTCCGQHQRSMAELGYRFLAIEEMSDDALAVRIVADVLGGAPARYHQSGIRGWINVSEGDIGVPTVARLFRIGIEARLKVVHDEV